MNDVSIVTLGKYNSIFEDFRKSVERFASTFPKVLVRDGSGILSPEGWTVVQAPDVFVCPRNCNLGWKATHPTHDVFLCGDDIRLLEENTVEHLREMAYSDSSIGLLSPTIKGGSASQQNPQNNVLRFCKSLAFLGSVYIKRSVIDAVGYMDEQFVGYGADDNDYCLRTLMAGYKIAVTNVATVQHGTGNDWTLDQRNGKIAPGLLPQKNTYLKNVEYDLHKLWVGNNNVKLYLAKWKSAYEILGTELKNRKAL